MKYQKLENQEINWKWQYLVRKSRSGENITHYLERSLIKEKIDELLAYQNYPKLIESWITQHMSPELRIKLDQAIRAKRKRFFNAEKRSTKKKSIDLEYAVWARLSKHSNKLGMTLSQTITHMIDEAENKEIYATQMEEMRQNIKAMLR